MALMTQMILEVPAPMTVVVELAQTTLRQLPATIERVDVDQGLILAKRSLSLSTYGEVLRVWIVPGETGGEGSARLTLQSELIAGFQVIDWGKNDANLRDFGRHLSALLAERGYGAPTLVADSAIAKVQVTSGRGQELDLVRNGRVVRTVTVDADPFTLTAKGEVVSVENGLATIKVVTTNQNGESVVEGEAVAAV